jgi:hypothetical protein
MRWLFPFLLLSGCFQAIDFPGQQADIDIVPVNDLDGEQIDEGIFDELVIQQVDQDNDGVLDFGLTTLFSLNANIDVETLCDEAAAANNLFDVLDAFDDAFFAGTITLVLSEPNQAVNLQDGDNIDGADPNGVFVVSFFIATQNGNIEVFANSLGEGEVDIDTIEGDLLNGEFTDNLALDFAGDLGGAGDEIDSDINGFLFNATRCDMQDLLIDTVAGTFNVNI